MKKIFIITLAVIIFGALTAGPVKAATLGQNLPGKILLQVEKNGEAWYVYPVSKQRYYLGRPEDAFAIMRSLGLGISNKDLNQIALPGEANINLALAKRLAGRIVLQVEGKGEAYYIDPQDFHRYYLGRPKDAFSVMRAKGLGITNADLKKITVAKDSLLPIPQVDLYVMSYCPYGLQTEKGILPVVKLLGDKINFKIKFVNYSMHGKQEIDEQLNQYCIQAEQADKFLNYLACFAESGAGADCLVKNNIDQNKLAACVTRTDSQFAITRNYNDQSTWYNGAFPPFNIYQDSDKLGVTGSPTLVIDGKVVSTNRDPASLLATICQSFVAAPAECNAVLSSAMPSPGFGLSASGGGSGNCLNPL